MAAAVQSDYVVKYLASDSDCDVPWLAMDYVRGQNLQQLIEAAGGLTGARLSQVGLQLATGLMHLHAAGSCPSRPEACQRHAAGQDGSHR